MYAVIDLETTGLAPRQNRVIEVTVVDVSADGAVERSWSTLLNPERDLGPQDVHGISASDVLFAPTFVDTMSGKAKRARELEVPIVDEATFDQMIAQLDVRAS